MLGGGEVSGLLQKMERNSAVLILVGSSFHQSGAKTGKSRDFPERA